MLKWIMIVSSLCLPSVGFAQIYQCQVNGQTVFADSPCGEDSKAVTVDPVTIGGRMDTGTDVETYQPPARAQRAEDPCPFINSTDLRRLTIQNKVVRGMKPADVRRSWGSPSSISTGRRTQWAYHYPDYSSSYVYFENGCVVSWNGYYANY